MHGNWIPNTKIYKLNQNWHFRLPVIRSFLYFRLIRSARSLCLQEEIRGVFLRLAYQTALNAKQTHRRSATDGLLTVSHSAEPHHDSKSVTTAQKHHNIMQLLIHLQNENQGRCNCDQLFQLAF